MIQNSIKLSSNFKSLTTSPVWLQPLKIINVAAMKTSAFEQFCALLKILDECGINLKSCQMFPLESVKKGDWIKRMTVVSVGKQSKSNVDLLYFFIIVAFMDF